MCTASGSELAAGAPALCERIALLQLEFRGDIHMDLFDSGDRDGDGDWREVGHHPGSQWVVFVDGGRGWLVGNPAGVDDGLTYPSTTLIPRLGTFRTDVGVGFDMGPVGVYVAKAISQSGIPANFFVRLGHRF
jgi:hypothetical protein